MIDPRFFKTNTPVSIAEIVTLTAATVKANHDETRLIKAVASPSAADLTDSIIFVTEEKYLSESMRGSPAACIVSPKLVEAAQASAQLANAVLVESDNPKAAFALVADRLHWSIAEKVGYADGGDSDIHQSVEISPNSVVCDGAEVGENVRIGPNSIIGPGVIVGNGTVIGSNVSITHAIIGNDCRILAGASIGEAGFGFVAVNGKQLRIPQLGRVILGNEVEIGANTTIDRGALADTTIGNQTKIDNLVQIAHNVQIGDRCAFAAQTGISGSAVIGNDVLLGGKVGIVDHIKIGDGATVMALSAPLKNVPPNEKWGGVPAKPARQWMRELAAIGKLGKK